MKYPHIENFIQTKIKAHINDELFNKLNNIYDEKTYDIWEEKINKDIVNMSTKEFLKIIDSLLEKDTFTPFVFYDIIRSLVSWYRSEKVECFPIEEINNKLNILMMEKDISRILRYDIQHFLWNLNR